jgi:hypothetical protein
MTPTRTIRNLPALVPAILYRIIVFRQRIVRDTSIPVILTHVHCYYIRPKIAFVILVWVGKCADGIVCEVVGSGGGRGNEEVTTRCVDEVVCCVAGYGVWVVGLRVAIFICGSVRGVSSKCWGKGDVPADGVRVYELGYQ